MSLSFVMCVIGRVDNSTLYSSSLIDTIIITSRTAADDPLLTAQKIDIKGRIVYSNGEPYSNGIVELRSQPRYTTTDSDGYFLFENVVVGTHTISAVRDNSVLASVSVNVEKTDQEEDIDIVRLDTGNLLVQVSLRVIEINIALRIDGKEMELVTVAVAKREEDPPAPGTEPGPDTPPEPVTPPEPDTPPVPEVPPDIPPWPDIPTEEEGAPGIIAADYHGTGVVWTVATSVDIFGPRLGNSGVKTIDGETVIAPGSAGVYTFKIENPDSRAVEYGISLKESDQNDPKLPMFYRLGAGLAGSGYSGDSPWKGASATSVKKVAIGAGETHYYTLEWKWVSDSDKSDTKIGLQESEPIYVLSILIEAWYK